MCARHFKSSANIGLDADNKTNECSIKYFAGSEPLGATIRLPRLATLPVPVVDPTFEVVGVIRDFANDGPRDLPAAQVWLAFPLRGPVGLGFVVRTNTDAAPLIRAVRDEVVAVDRQAALVDPTTLDAWMQRAFLASQLRSASLLINWLPIRTHFGKRR